MENLAIQTSTAKAFGSIMYKAFDKVNSDYDTFEECIEDNWLPIVENDDYLQLVKGTWRFDIGYNEPMIVTLTDPTIGQIQDLVLGQKLLEFHKEEKDLGWCCAPFEALQWNMDQQCFTVVTGS